MRILVISNLYPPDGFGGYERVCADQSNALARRGHDLCVLTTVLSARNVRQEERNISVCRRLHLANEYNPLVDEPSFVNVQSISSRLINSHNIAILAEHLEAFRPDVVLLFNLLGLGAQQLLATLDRLKLPWVWCLGDTIPADIFELSELSELNALMPYAGDNGSGALSGTFISPSKRLLSDIERRGCRLEGEFKLIANWVHCQGDLVRDYFKPGQVLRLCYSGYISDEKGFTICLQALQELQERGHRNFVFNVYGDGALEKFAALARELSLSDVVQFHGFKEQRELFSLYQQNDVLLFPALSKEPFGSVSIEAAAHGCLPILGNQAGAAEWLTDRSHCLHVTRNAQSFAEAIELVLSGQFDLGAVAQNAADCVRNRFTLDAASSEYERILQEKATAYQLTAFELESASMLASLIERVAFAAVEEHLQERRQLLANLNMQVARLEQDLAEAKRGITAYDIALVGARNELSLCQQQLTIVKNSRVWKLRDRLQSIFGFGRDSG